MKTPSIIIILFAFTAFHAEGRDILSPNKATSPLPLSKGDGFKAGTGAALKALSFGEGSGEVEFIENKGQLTYSNGVDADDILFTASTNEGQIYVRRTGLSFVFISRDQSDSNNKVWNLNPRNKSSRSKLLLNLRWRRRS